METETSAAAVSKVEAEMAVAEKGDGYVLV